MHLIRNTFHLTSKRDWDALKRDLRPIYTAPNPAAARAAFEDLAERPIHELSYGQRKRVAIAGALAMRPCVMLLDEPTAGLDPQGVDEMVAALESLLRAQTTVVISTHDVDFALWWADSVAVLVDGRLLQPHRPVQARALRAPAIATQQERKRRCLLGGRVHAATVLSSIMRSTILRMRRGAASMAILTVRRSA